MGRPIEELKNSEARLLIYLQHAAKPLKEAQSASYTLKIDQSYVIRILDEMRQKGWVKPYKYEGKTFYSLTLLAPYADAVILRAYADQQQKLRT
jgi:DNA-binding MarR family transcriptional regulator